VRRAPTERLDQAGSVLRLERNHVHDTIELARSLHVANERGGIVAVAEQALGLGRDLPAGLPAVVDRHLVAALHKLARERRADQSGAADDEYAHSLRRQTTGRAVPKLSGFVPVLPLVYQRLGSLYLDSDDHDFATRSPNKTFYVVRVACENHGVWANSYCPRPPLTAAL
jgi:hypothetical protein